MKLEQLVTETTTLVGLCKDEEGMKTTTEKMIENLRQKVLAKTTNEAIQKTVTCANTVQSESGPYDLGAKGDAVLRSLDVSLEKLALLKDLTTSLATTDPTKYEYSASYLFKAYSAAQAADIEIPNKTIEEVVRRRVNDAPRDEKFGGCN